LLRDRAVAVARLRAFGCQLRLAVPSMGIDATDCVALEFLIRSALLGLHKRVADRPLAADPPSLAINTLTVNVSPRFTLVGAVIVKLSTGGSGAGAGSTVTVTLAVAVPPAPVAVRV
jgi:hypothetical protein